MLTLKRIIPAFIVVLALLAACDKKDHTIAVGYVTLDRTELALIKGQSEPLSANVYPDNATDKTVAWNSSNTSVATVDQNGRVTAIGGGVATITANAGDKQAFCAVTVTVPVSSVTLDKTELALVQGNSETLSATVNPSDASDKTVIWSSSDTAVATVDTNGKVTAVKAGKSIITVKAGEFSATCTVTVAPSNIPGGHEGTGEEPWN